jgi:hypothetical protein
VKLKGVIARFRRNHSAFGLWNTLRAFGIRAMQRVIRVKVLRAMYVTAVAPTLAEVPADLRAGFLDRDTLRQLSAHAKYDLSPGFLDTALSKGDECYAIMDGVRLAAYGWYARTPTNISDNLAVHFDDAYVYMYKGLTLDAYRGRRLHAIGKAGALAVYRARGYKGLVSYVESDNLSSLRSNHRMGCVDIGWIWTVRIFGKDLTFRTPGCEAFGFNVVPLCRAGPSRPPEQHPPDRSRTSAGEMPSLTSGPVTP